MTAVMHSHYCPYEQVTIWRCASLHPASLLSKLSKQDEWAVALESPASSCLKHRAAEQSKKGEGGGANLS